MLRTNFLKTAFASMLVVCAMGFYSCSSDDGEPETPPTESSIVGKWDVQSNTRAAGDAKYGSFEFTADNKYIITQPAVATNGDKYMLVIFGDYVVGNTESNDFTLNLKEFGTIKISITENHASITIDGVVYVAVKAAEVDLTENTKKLVGTWEITTQYAGETEPVYDGTMTFTSAGTYLSRFISDPGTDNYDIDNGTWSWKPNNILSVSYTVYYASITEVGPNGEIIKPGESWVETEFDDWKITELTDNKFVAEVYDEDGTGYIFGTKK